MNPNQPQYPPPAGQPGMAPAKPNPVANATLTDAVIGISGLLVFLLSFAPLYSASGAFGGSISSWKEPFAPVSTWVALAGLVTVLLVVASLWWPRDKQYLGFTRGQLLVGVTLFMAVEMIGFLFATPTGVDFGAGGWIMLLFSLAAVVFAILGHLGKMQGSVGSMMKSSSSAPAAYPGAYQPPAGGYQPPPAGYTQPTQPAQPGYQPGAYPPPGQPGQYPPPGQG